MGRLIDADTLKYELLADNYNAKMTPQMVTDLIRSEKAAHKAALENAHKVDELLE